MSLEALNKQKKEPVVEKFVEKRAENGFGVDSKNYPRAARNGGTPSTDSKSMSFNTEVVVEKLEPKSFEVTPQGKKDDKDVDARTPLTPNAKPTASPITTKEEINLDDIPYETPKELPKPKTKEEIQQKQSELSPKQAPIVVVEHKEYIDYPKTQVIVNIEDKKKEAKEGMALYDYVVDSILNKESDYQLVENKSDPKKSKSFIVKTGVRKLMLAFNISAKIVEQKVWMDEKGIYQAVVKAIAIAPNGRFMESMGACSQNEKNRTRTMHDTLATAETRAKSRAGLDLCGLGAVSYEEMEG